jgi:hypothetical protein
VLNNFAVRTYSRGGRYHFKLIWLVIGSAGASERSYDSGQKNGGGYALEDEANQAGWKIIRCTLLNILNLFVERWSNGCTAQEWQAFPAIGAPAIVWDRIFFDLVQGEYIKDQQNGFVITETGMELRTQLKELGGPRSSMTSLAGKKGKIN